MVTLRHGVLDLPRDYISASKPGQDWFSIHIIKSRQ